MIPILYESTETQFVSNGLGRLRDCISCKVTEERNGIYEVEFEYPVDGAHFSDIRLGRIIGVEHDETSDVQPFDIYACTRPIDGKVTFRARHISYRLSGIVAYNSRANRVDSLTAALNYIWLFCYPANPFTFSADFTASGFLASADGIPRSVRQIMGGIEGSILDAYGGEWEFDKWRCILHRQRGEERAVTIRYGVNLVDYTEEIDYSESYNMVKPFWYSETDGTVVGDLIDSGETMFNDADFCVPLDLTDKFETKPTKAELESTARGMLSGVTLPTQNIEVDFIRLQDTEEYKQYASLQKCRLCDTVRVVFPKYKTEARFKIVSTVYDVLAERFESMELGDLQTTLSEALGISESPTPTSSGKEPVALSASDFTVTTGEFVSGSYMRQGAVVFMSLLIKNTSSVASNSNVFAGTLNNVDLRPAARATGAGYYQQHAINANFVESGAITVRNASSSAVTPTNGVGISFTYMIT